jgi:16S rRNA (guanine527-N7)-methyltransferase
MQIGSKEWSDLIIEGAGAFDIALKSDQTRQFTVHARELIHWKKTFNITSITDPVEVALKHFLDSLPAAHHIPPDATLLDIGSGGGFPGIPLKILMPSLTVTLIDASRKKVSFLKHVIRSLKLDHIEALHMRAENLITDPLYRKRFDVVISRAFSALALFVRLARPLRAPGGRIIALKGQTDKNELNDLRNYLFGEGISTSTIGHDSGIAMENYNLPFLNAKRSIIVLSGQLD